MSVPRLQPGPSPFAVVNSPPALPGSAEYCGLAERSLLGHTCSLGPRVGYNSARMLPALSPRGPKEQV